MAIACLRLVTFFLLRPDFSLPFFMARISRSTDLPAAGLYFRLLEDFFAAVFFAGLLLADDFFAEVFFAALFFFADFFFVAIDGFLQESWDARNEYGVAA